MDASQVLQVTEMVQALQSPGGIPNHPIIFMGLAVLTFALHILFVQLMLGTSLITLWGAFSKAHYWRRLASAMLEVAKVSTSVAIVLGVAPLLFVQVVYDPHWYTSNVLSAMWVIAFIFILIVAYWAIYYYYFQNNKHKDKTVQPKARWSMVLSLVLMLVVGFIMHSLTSQMLHPELWKTWYTPNGVLDYSGSKLHAYNLWRFAFFISMAIPVAGAMLVSYRRFKSVRSDADQDYLNWAGALGKKWIKVGSIVATGLYIAWMMTLPETAGDFATSFWGIIGGVLVLSFALWAQFRLKGEAKFCSYMALPVALVIGLMVAISREMLRYTILDGFFGYNFLDYKIVFDWFSTIHFFATFLIVGGSVLTYFLTVAWQAGQTVGVYTPSPFVDRLGTIAIWIISIWTFLFLAVGFYVWAFR
ncbi:MAG: hypothetical protein GXO35_06215 [Gammaproteobacteria bacterium]|nr:hypothetical protein [Gammaproteobacteria bacterium]